jgi:alanyl-tRNA synthetase
VAAGVRRIEAATGAGALQHHQATRAALDDVLGALGSTAERARAAVEHLQTENKRLAREMSKLKTTSAALQGLKDTGPDSSPGLPFEETRLPRGVFVGQLVTDFGKDELRQLADQHRDRIKTGIVAIASISQMARSTLVIAVTKDLLGTVHAGNMVKELASALDARGGGRPDFAEAGSPSPTFASDALGEARKLAGRALE